MTRPAIRLATVYFQDRPQDYVEWVKVADDVGFDLIGYGDSQSLWPELYVSLTLAALHTTSALVGPVVTNPRTRHPAVSASAMATLQHLTDGRAFYGLSSGDSALYNIGLRPSTVAGVEAYGTAVRDLCAGRPVDWEGSQLELRWGPRPVPLYLAAEGPLMLRLAGRIADGVIVSNGLTEDVVRRTIELVRSGAVEAGRDPDAIDIWWLVKFRLAPSVAEGIEALKFTLAASANHVFRFTTEDKGLPESLRGPIVSLQEAYAFEEHARVDDTAHNATLTDRFGLTDWLADRFAVTGPAGHCAERLQEIAGYGASNLLLTQLVSDPIGAMRAWQRDVFPRIR